MIGIETGLLEFSEGGNTIWVHSIDGTVLRIKCTGRITVDRGCTNNVPHADVWVEGDIKMCLPERGWEQVKTKVELAQ